MNFGLRKTEADPAFRPEMALNCNATFSCTIATTSILSDRLCRATRKSCISGYMALYAAELDALITDLAGQYRQLSREYSEMAYEQLKDEIADTMCAIDYQLARLEEQQQILSNVRTRAVAAG
jgi:hypothetical protein